MSLNPVNLNSVPNAISIDDAIATDAASGLRALWRRIAALGARFVQTESSARERHLAGAVDHQDLERRMCAWDQHQQRMAAIQTTL